MITEMGAMHESGRGQRALRTHMGQLVKEHTQRTGSLSRSGKPSVSTGETTGDGASAAQLQLGQQGAKSVSWMSVRDWWFPGRCEKWVRSRILDALVSKALSDGGQVLSDIDVDAELV